MKVVENSKNESLIIDDSVLTNIAAKEVIQQYPTENVDGLKIQFAIIDSLSYVNYYTSYSFDISFDSSIINRPRSSFSLSVNNSLTAFECDSTYVPCTYYGGFMNSLNKYILTDCGYNVCSTYLLDKKTGKTNHLEGPFDSAVNTPIVSKDKRQMITYSSSVFDRESYLAIYKTAASKQINFTTWDSFYTSDWRIYQIVWIDEHSIALTVYDDYGGQNGAELINKQYLTGTIL